MRLLKKLLPLLAVLLLLPACAKKTIESPAGGYAFASLEDVPPFEEFRQLPPGEAVKVRHGLESIPVDGSCALYYRDLASAFLEEEGLAEYVTVRGVSVVKDGLALIQGQNKKSLRDMNFEIRLVMDITDVPDYFALADTICQQLRDSLEGDTFYAAKQSRSLLSVSDQYGFTLHRVDGRSSAANETVFKEQSETEYAAQTAAYDFRERERAFVLSRFGAIPETGELCVEYYVEDSYFGRGEKEIRENINGLEAVRDEIERALLGEEATSRYIRENGLETLTISFRNGIFEDGDLLTFRTPL